MPFFGLFRKNEKELEALLHKRGTDIFQESAVAAAFAEAGEHATASALAEGTGTSRKILVIGQGNTFSANLTHAAVDIARRFDCAILALNVTDAPLALAQGERDSAAAAFARSCAANVGKLEEKAGQAGIAFIHLVEIGKKKDIVEKIHAGHPDIRYILTEAEKTGPTGANVAIAVCEPKNLRGAAA
ncbi:MAG: hypothetical protein ACOY32_00765 [Thermodesulfobacteriota bacterium]